MQNSGYEFHLNALYFCTRCGKEIGGRTVADLMVMPRMSADDLEKYRDEMYSSTTIN
jgi:DNA-directed RNA polymerase subunit RPC12/RpoP